MTNWRRLAFGRKQLRIRCRSSKLLSLSSSLARPPAPPFSRGRVARRVARDVGQRLAGGGALLGGGPLRSRRRRALVAPAIPHRAWLQLARRASRLPLALTTPDPTPDSNPDRTQVRLTRRSRSCARRRPWSPRRARGASCPRCRLARPIQCEMVELCSLYSIVLAL